MLCITNLIIGYYNYFVYYNLGVKGCSCWAPGSTLSWHLWTSDSQHICCTPGKLLFLQIGFNLFILAYWMVENGLHFWNNVSKYVIIVIKYPNVIKELNHTINLVLTVICVVVVINYLSRWCISNICLFSLSLSSHNH